jgi:hypothetical protein
LIGLVGPPGIKYLDRAKTNVAAVDIRNLESALYPSRIDLRCYPTQRHGRLRTRTFP